MATLESLLARAIEGNGHSNLVQEIKRRIDELRAVIDKEPYVFNRRFLLRVLSMGHSQFAEFIGARGPNTQINSACATTTQAVSLAEDWIRAGKLVFESDTSFFPAPATPGNPRPGCPPASDGTYTCQAPGTRYYIRQKGVVEVGGNSCAGCHTRYLPDGTLFEGGQGQPLLRAPTAIIRDSTPEEFQKRVDNAWRNYGAPWVTSKEEFEKNFTKDEYIREFDAQQPSVFPRQGTSLTHPVRVPSLVGIADIKYLDATGLVRNRGIADIIDRKSVV